MNSYQTVCGVVMADGVDGGVVHYDSWKYVSTVYYNDESYPHKEGEENNRRVDYWIVLKNGGLVECHSEYWEFSKRLGMEPDIKGGVKDMLPIIKVKGKPFLPSGDLVRASGS